MHFSNNFFTTFRRRYGVLSLLLAPFLAFGFIELIFPVDLTPKQGSRIVLAEDGTPLRAFADQQGIWRHPIALDDVSPRYLTALIHYEDRYFYQHPGVNPLALARAFGQAIREGKVISGGSTLTMQVARMRYPEPRTLWGKTKEMVRAIQLELHYSKAEILTYYLNHAPFGGTIEGVQAAALSYFGYSAKDLTHAQAALLAVLPQAPSRYRPDKNPSIAQAARDKVIDRLVQFHIWSEQIGVDAKQETVFASQLHRYQNAPLLARRLASNSQQRVIHSTINARWQQNIETIVKDYVENIAPEVSAAVLIMDNQTGEVKTYVGSADMNNPERFGHVDMVSAIRSPGSTLKPFIYGQGFDQGFIHSESLLMNVPLKFSDYQPENFNGGFSGPVSVARALATSLNVPAVQVLEHLGPVPFYLSLQAAGAVLKLPNKAPPTLAIALGGLGSNLESLVRLFSALDNQGQTVEPIFTQDQTTTFKPLLTPGSAWITRYILASAPNAPMGLAVKTGTSYGFRDSWAIGVADGYSFGVWVGKPDGSPLTGHYGRQTAVPLLSRIAAMVIHNNAMPARPASVSQADICWPTGRSEAEHLCDQSRLAWLLHAEQPSTWMTLASKPDALAQSKTSLNLATDTALQVPFGCELATTKKEIALWPAPLQPWLASDFRNSAKLAHFDPRCDQTLTSAAIIPVKIGGVEKGDAMMANAQDQGVIKLFAEGGQPPYHWYVNGKKTETSSAQFALSFIAEHQYDVVLMDYHGQLDRIQLTSYFE